MNNKELSNKIEKIGDQFLEYIDYSYFVFKRFPIKVNKQVYDFIDELNDLLTQGQLDTKFIEQAIFDDRIQDILSHIREVLQNDFRYLENN